MSTATKSVAVSAKRESMLATAHHIDQLALQAAGVFESAAGFAEALVVAQTMNDIRAALTDDMMQPVMALMNSPLGFVTDQDPRTNKDARPYGVEVVRECFIESKLRGFNPVGNEWNIIAGRFYAAKNGLRRKVTKFPGLTEFRDSYDVPRVASEKGAIIKVRATWKLNGVADAIEAEIPIRVNSYMGTDAIIGKAERKLLKRILDRVSGFFTPDGEVDDGELETMKRAEPVPTAPAPKFSEPAVAAPPPSGETKFSVPVEQWEAMAKLNDAQQREKYGTTRAELMEKSISAGATKADAAEAAPTPTELVQRTLTAGKVSFDDFRDWLRTTGLLEDPSSLTSVEELPPALVKMLLADGQKVLGKCVTIYGGAK